MAYTVGPSAGVEMHFSGRWCTIQTVSPWGPWPAACAEHLLGDRLSHQGQTQLRSDTMLPENIAQDQEDSDSSYSMENPTLPCSPYVVAFISEEKNQ